MSKLAIILCAMLFASAANAYFSSRARKTARRVVDVLILEAEEEFQVTQEKASQVGLNRFFTEILTFDRKILNRTAEIPVKVIVKIRELVDKAKGVDISKCIKLCDHPANIANSAISNTSICIVDKLRPVHEHIENIDRISGNVRSTLRQIKKAVQQCDDNVGGVESVGTFISCVKVAADKATSIITNVIPELIANINKVELLLEYLQSTLAHCTTTNNLTAFYAVVERIETCIQQKSSCEEVDA